MVNFPPGAYPLYEAELQARKTANRRTRKPCDDEAPPELSRLKKGITKAGYRRKEDGLRYQLQCIRAHIAAIERHTAELKANLNMASSILTKRRR